MYLSGCKPDVAALMQTTGFGQQQKQNGVDEASDNTPTWFLHSVILYITGIAPDTQLRGCIRHNMEDTALGRWDSRMRQFWFDPHRQARIAAIQLIHGTAMYCLTNRKALSRGQNISFWRNFGSPDVKAGQGTTNPPFYLQTRITLLGINGHHSAAQL